MTVTPSIDAARLIEEQLAQASPDLLRELLTSFINTLMSAEADAVCGAAHGTSSPERTNRRNGYRARDFDTRTGCGCPGRPTGSARWASSANRSSDNSVGCTPTPETTGWTRCPPSALSPVSRQTNWHRFSKVSGPPSTRS